MTSVGLVNPRLKNPSDPPSVGSTGGQPNVPRPVSGRLMPVGTSLNPGGGGGGQ